jgi:hypothetical protein
MSPLSERAKIEILCAIVGLLGVAICFYSWLQEHDARLKAETDAQVRQQAFDQAGDQIKKIQAAAEERDRQSAARVDELIKTAAAAKTPAQIAGYSQEQLDRTIAGLKITIPAPTPADPHPAAIATIPESSLTSLRDAIAACQVDSEKLSSCSADLADRKKEQALAQTQIEQLQGQVTDYKKAAGKTFWTRAWHYTELGLGVGAGFVIGKAAAKK